MLLEKPVVSTNCDPIKRIVEETDSGKIYASNNSSELSDAIISLYNTKNGLPDMGKRGKSEILKKYNWETAGTSLVNLYKKIESGIEK
jgi:glycosyltransferase involved in cell wall biosynthesis